jgi:cytochrome oxidase Cu insertion factor (SCO1/SenC/PrrC family)
MQITLRSLMLRVVCVHALFGGAAGAQERLPAPQIASATGQPAPDFILRNQLGIPVQLSRLRPHPVLLVFYRGHW